MIRFLKRLFTRKRVIVHHVRAKAIDYDAVRRATTARLVSEIRDADIEARLRQAGAI